MKKIEIKIFPIFIGVIPIKSCKINKNEINIKIHDSLKESDEPFMIVMCIKLERNTDK